MNIPDALLGPVAALAGALVIIGFLSRLLLQFINDLRTNLALALKGWQDQTEANRVLSEAQASRNRDDEMRQRLAEVKRS